MNVRLDIWPPLPPGAPFRRARADLPFPLDRPGHRLYAKGRHALYAGLKALGLGEGDAALVPAFHHGSEIEALRRAGLHLRFYETGAELVPDPHELEGLLDGEVKVLHLIHVLGLPQNAALWRAWCDEHGLFLSEDVAQGWMGVDGEGSPLGSKADLAIYCLYKSFGIPEGAALWCSERVEEPQPGGRGVARVPRRMAWWAMGRSAAAASLGERLLSRRTWDPAADRDLDEPIRAPAGATTFLLPRVYDPAAARRRRAHYGRLLELLADMVPRPFETMPAGAAPFAFPIEAENAHALISGLKRRGVGALPFWSQPHPSLPVEHFPASARRRDRTVALPVHQELRDQDLDAIVAAVHSTSRI